MATRRREPIPARVRREVLDGSCAYCGYWNATEVDHVIPFSHGGSSDRDNLAPSCKRCNHEKLDFTPEQWKAWRQETGRPWPPANPETVLLDLCKAFPAEHTEAMSAATRAGDEAIFDLLNRIFDEHHDGRGRSTEDDVARLVVVLADASARRLRQRSVLLAELADMRREWEMPSDVSTPVARIVARGRGSIHKREAAELIGRILRLFGDDEHDKLRELLDRHLLRGQVLTA